MEVLVNYLTNEIRKPLTKKDAEYILKRNGYIKDNELTKTGKQLLKLVNKKLKRKV